MIGKLVKTLVSDHRRVTVAAAVFLVIGMAIVGAYAEAVDYTNRLEFCAFSCHEMSIPYGEYKESSHYQNQFGVRAECPDCHVPHKKWQFTMQAKILATSDLFTHLFWHLTRTPDVPQQFENDRLDLAKHVWARMKATDSRECRNCHSFEGMALAKQSDDAQAAHAPGNIQETGKTCIDCHKGIVHHLPKLKK